MLIVLPFIANAGLNFIIGLLIAQALGPEEFGLYAIASSGGMVVITLGLEWLRQSATRFYSAQSRDTDPHIRATLDRAYITICLVILFFTFAVIGISLIWQNAFPRMLIVSGILAWLALAFFDYQAALARARFLELTYARIVIIKNVLAFVLMAGAAFTLKSASSVLLGAFLSAGIAIGLVYLTLHDPNASWKTARVSQAKTFALYAFPLVIGNLVFQIMPFVNRTLLASHFGLAEAGIFSLAADLCVRLFATFGSGMDILMFQLAVRENEHNGEQAGMRQVKKNMGFLVVLLFPFAAGFWLVMPSFEALIVPSSFHGRFKDYATILIPAMLAFAVIQYGLNPVFQLRKRTVPVIIAAIIGLFVNIIMAFTLPLALGSSGYAYAQLGGMAATLITLAALALRQCGFDFPWRDIVLSALFAGLMALCLKPWRYSCPEWVTLPALCAVGFVIYSALALVFNVSDIRKTLSAQWHKRKRLHHVP